MNKLDWRVCISNNLSKSNPTFYYKSCRFCSTNFLTNKRRMWRWGPVNVHWTLFRHHKDQESWLILGGRDPAECTHTSRLGTTTPTVVADRRNDLLLKILRGRLWANRIMQKVSVKVIHRRSKEGSEMHHKRLYISIVQITRFHHSKMVNSIGKTQFFFKQTFILI